MGNSKNYLKGWSYFNVYYEKCTSLKTTFFFNTIIPTFFFSLKVHISQREIKYPQRKARLSSYKHRIYKYSCRILLKPITRQFYIKCSVRSLLLWFVEIFLDLWKSLAYTCKYTESNKYGNKYSKRVAVRWKYGTQCNEHVSYTATVFSPSLPPDSYGTRVVTMEEEINVFINKCVPCPTTILIRRNSLAGCFSNS